MIQGANTPVLPTFDLQFENYSWMDYLAGAGFDVFAMDLTGYGLSPRPKMDDPCNTSESDQRAFLIPETLSNICPPSYPFRLSTTQTDWDEIDTVVDYVRQLRGVDRIHLIGWSRGGHRAGTYAARHRDKVEKLFLYAPAMYNRFGSSDPPDVVPGAGVPTTIVGRGALFNVWNGQVGCENQFTPAIREVIASTVMEVDAIGSTWGTEGVQRSPVQPTPLWGWNQEFARQVDAPTIIIRGDLDTQAPLVGHQLRELFADLGSANKVFVHVACTGHQFVWENRHLILLRASEEWLRRGTFYEAANGSFAVDKDGRVIPEP
jgi:pimeloyl-ACP methyl ester carboxylesterase